MIAGVSDLQAKILAEIYRKEPQPPVGKLDGILNTILSFSPEQAQDAFGQFGRKLRLFASIISLSHPDLRKFVGGQLVGEQQGTFSKDACDVLRLVSYGLEKDRLSLSINVLDALKKVVTKHDFYKSLSLVIDSPFDNQQNIRFVPSREDRDMIRTSKRAQPVNLSLIKKRGREFWDSQTTDLMPFSRFFNAFQRDIEEAKSRQEHFTKFGLKIMADEIQKSIAELEAASSESQYYGFNKISLSVATAVLAKQSGFTYIERPNHLDGDTIVADPDDFTYRFFAKKDNLIDDSHVSVLECLPRIYAYHELEPHASLEVLKLIDHLEGFPDAEGFSIFDHYRVLVPGLNYPNTFGTSYECSIRLADGSLFRSTSLQKIQMRLDIELLQEKQIVAALLGERDGEFYFISYF